MKVSIPGVRILAGIGLAALMIGCTEFLGSEKASDAKVDSGITDESGTLSLSIKDDPGCREQWGRILEARSAGKADSAGEAAFLAACVKEVRVVKDTPKPVIPPSLVPDSGTRCKWIIAQIEGGRDSLTVSYKKYCPEDCKVLEAKDSVSHIRLCRDPGTVIPPKTRPVDTGTVTKPRDSLIILDPMADTCRMLRGKIAMLKEGDPARAELEKLALAYCKVPATDTARLNAERCKHMYQAMMALDPATPEYAKAKETWYAHCGGPGVDTVVMRDTCAVLRHKWEAAKGDDSARAEIEARMLKYCGKIPPTDLPLDTCKLLYERLMKMDPASPEYAKAKEAWYARCGAVVIPKDPVIIKPLPTTRDSICADLKLRISKATDEKQRLELEAAYKAKCLDPVVVKDPPVVVDPVSDCEAARKKLSMLDPASADYARLAAYIKERCGDAVPVK